MRSFVTRACGYTLGLLMIAYSMERHLLAGGPIVAPEIDGNSITSGLALLAGGILMLRARRRSR
jgi:hypothetical protein